MRNKKFINYEWYYKPSFTNEDILMPNSTNGFEKIQIPHTNIELPYNYFDETLYQFESCYKKRLDISAQDIENDLLITFEGVMTYAKVYLNGIELGEHKGGYTPFGFAVDYLTYGGIYREVYLENRALVSIDHCFVKTKQTADTDFSIELDLNFRGTLSNQNTINCCIVHNDATVHTFSRNDLHKKNKLILENVKNIFKWTPDSPELYWLIVELLEDNKIIDRFETRFGFREVSFRNDGFYLNDENIQLRGLNRHQSFPYVGYAMPKNAQVMDAEYLKYDLGVNVVRCSHYPQSRHFLNRCDEIGLLVFSEIPGWQHIGDEAWQEVALQNVEEMITRDFNHPSVIIWGVRINESQDNNPFYKKTNALAHLLDNTRPTGGVRNFAGSKVYEDVYTYNDFVHRGFNAPLENPKKIAKSKMPYLVTEHNGHMFPTKKFDHEYKRIEHAIRHARALNEMYATPEISGAIGWCMFDYNTHKDFGSGDQICYHGVMDMFRIPKYASSVYASQSDIEPVMEVLSSMQIGEFEASELGTVYIFTNCDYVKVYKNNRFINTFFPDKDCFAFLPHPPILVDDFIGDQIEENEHFSKQDSKTIKEILNKVTEFGTDLPLKYKLNYADGVELYGKYMSTWGNKSTDYQFEGYKNDTCVVKSIKSAEIVPKLVVSPDSNTINECDSYDVVRVVVGMEDQHGNSLPYAQEFVELTVSGPVKIIGPSRFSLIGGSRAFWIKSTGIKGASNVTVHLIGYSSISVPIEIL